MTKLKDDDTLKGVQVSVNQIDLHFELGSFSIRWGASGLLSSISWNSFSRVAAVSEEPLVPTPKWIPGFIDHFREYCSMGKPLQRTPWELIDVSEWSEFQKNVFRAASMIPHGETRSYRWIASKIGQPKASRAVGQALKRNPLLILVPCHRVVPQSDPKAGDENLGGFMGITEHYSPEVNLKKNLIDLERLYLNPLFSFLSAPAPAAFEVHT